MTNKRLIKIVVSPADERVVSNILQSAITNMEEFETGKDKVVKYKIGDAILTSDNIILVGSYKINKMVNSELGINK